MSKTFKRGDHVKWNSEAGRVRDVIIKKVISAVRFKGYMHHASRAEPQYKGQALKHIKAKKKMKPKKTKARRRTS